MQYKVLAALKEDINQGWVWISHPHILNRSIVEIKNKNTRKSVFCEALQIDVNYKYSYENGWTNELPKSEAVITMNAWYRSKLQINETNRDYDLGICPANHLYGMFMANIQHPQVVVRMAMWLGSISVILGVTGVWFACHA